MNLLQKLHYRKDIDGLRAIAVWAVIFFHLNEHLLPSGFVGVDVFFVLSGYVVSRSMIAHEFSLGETVKWFYVRRIKRLMPALIIMILFGYLVLCAFVPPVETLQMLKTAQSALFGFSNMSLIQSSLDYFGVENELNPFTHTWSLAVEEQFYLLYPLMFFFYRKKIKSGQYGQIFFYSSLLFLLSLSAFVIDSFTPAARTYYLMPLRFWELSAGVIFFFVELLWSEKKCFKMLADERVKLFFLGLLFLTFFISTPIDRFPLLPILLANFAAFFLLPETSEGKVYLAKVLSSKPFQFFGKISYSLYLYHFLIFSLMRWTIGLETLSLQLSAIVITLILSTASYYFIENPIRFSRMKNTVVISFILISCALLFTTIWNTPAWIRKLQIDGYTPLAFNRFKRPKIWNDGVEKCHFRYYERPKEDVFNECLKSSERRTLFIAGDSHGLQLVSAAEKVGMAIGFGTRYIHNDGIPKMIDQISIPEELEYILKNGKMGDMILLTFYRGKLLPTRYHIPLKNDPFKEEGVLKKISNFKQSFDLLYSKAHKKGIKLLLVADTPQMKLPMRITPCIFQSKFGLPNSCDVSRLQSLHTRLPMTALFQELSARDGVYYWDPHNFICDSELCTFENSKFVKMTDFNHISLDQALELSPHLERYLKTNWIK